MMPTNLCSPGDNYHPENSHVIPALMHRFHEAAQANADAITVWGSGKPMREFLHVDDMASASIHVMNLPIEKYQAVTEPRRSHSNVGTGVDCTIAEVTGYSGAIHFDTSKSDGAPRKLMDNAKLASLGWAPAFSLKAGLENTYEWFTQHGGALRE